MRFTVSPRQHPHLERDTALRFSGLLYLALVAVLTGVVLVAGAGNDRLGVLLLLVGLVLGGADVAWGLRRRARSR